METNDSNVSGLEIQNVSSFPTCEMAIYSLPTRCTVHPALSAIYYLHDYNKTGLYQNSKNHY